MASCRDGNIGVQQTLEIVGTAQEPKVDQFIAKFILDALKAFGHHLILFTNNGGPKGHLALVKLDKRLGDELRIFVVFPLMRPHQMQHLTALRHQTLWHSVKLYWEVEHLAFRGNFLVDFLQFEIGMDGQELGYTIQERAAIIVGVKQQQIGGKTKRVRTEYKQLQPSMYIL